MLSQLLSSVGLQAGTAGECSSKEGESGLPIPTLPLESEEVKIFLVWFCYAVVKASKHQPFILSSHLGGHGVLLGSPGAFQAFFRGRSHSGPPYAGHTPSRQRSLAPGGNHLSTSSWPTPGGHPSGCGWYSWPVVVCGRTSPPALCQSCSTSSRTGMATLSLCTEGQA